MDAGGRERGAGSRERVLQTADEILDETKAEHMRMTVREDKMEMGEM